MRIGQQKLKDTSNVPGMAVTSSSLVAAALPMFLVGGLAVQIRSDLGLTESALGAAVTIGFVVGAVAAPFGGRLADRIGPRRSVYAGAALSAIALLGLGALAETWAVLVLFLAVAGFALAAVDPGLAILVDRAVTPERHGLAFGLKEASIPAAALVAGLAVPIIALTVGWRWAFLLGVIPISVIVLLFPGVSIRPATQTPEPGHPVHVAKAPHRRTVGFAVVGAALGTASASGVGVFLTESAVAMGVSEGGAGILLAIGGVAGIIARISTGVVADRTGGTQYRLISIMLAVGAVTIALGGTGSTALLILGTIGTFAAAWAWTGIFFLSLLKTNPASPGAVAGLGTASLGVGNASGPFLFGLLAENYSFGAAWLWAGIAAGLGAIAMAMARRSL